MRWIVERCLAKDPEERYASTKDLARDLRSVRDHLSETSVSGGLEAAEPARVRRRGWRAPGGPGPRRGSGHRVLRRRACALRALPPQFQRLTLRAADPRTRVSLPTARRSIYGAAWDGGPLEIFSTRADSPESRSLGLPGADLLAVSSAGELAVSLDRHYLFG